MTVKYADWFDKMILLIKGGSDLSIIKILILSIIQNVHINQSIIKWSQCNSFECLNPFFSLDAHKIICVRVCVFVCFVLGDH